MSNSNATTRDSVAKEVGRLLSLWTTLKANLEGIGSRDPVGDLFTVIPHVPVASAIARTIRRNLFQRVGVYGRIQPDYSPIMAQLRALDGFSLHKDLNKPQIQAILESSEPLQAPLSYEVLAPRRKMTLGEAHELILHRPDIEPCSPQELVALRRLDLALLPYVYASRTLGCDNRGSDVALGIRRISKPSRYEFFSADVCTMLEVDSGIFVRRIDRPIE